MKLDAYDINILVALQQNGRMTKLKLAEQINLSPSPCWERLRRLEQAGIIRSYHAEVDLDQVLKTITVWVELALQHHRAHDFGRFEAMVRDVPEIVECWATGGGVDYVLKVVTTDIDNYQRLMDRLLLANLGIDRYCTYIVTKPVKRASGYPLEHLLALSASEEPQAQLQGAGRISAGPE